MSVSQQRMAKVVAGQPSKSAKIRALHALGCSRSEIAKYMDVRYQFVRNVLVDEERRKDRGQKEGSESVNPTGNTMRVRVGADGQISIPAAFREALGIKPNDVLVLSQDQEELRLMTFPAAIRKAQAIVRKFVPEGVNLVDELLEDRRREVEAEDE